MLKVSWALFCRFFWASSQDFHGWRTYFRELAFILVDSDEDEGEPDDCDNEDRSYESEAEAEGVGNDITGSDFGHLMGLLIWGLLVSGPNVRLSSEGCDPEGLEFGIH